MRPRFLLPLSLLAIAAALLVLLRPAPRPGALDTTTHPEPASATTTRSSTEEQPETATASEPAPAKTLATEPAPRPRTSFRIPIGQPIPELVPHQAERDAIQTLASTYDTANVPKIAPYLTHADASVRLAARMGLIQVGDASAVPYLRSALAAATDDEERAALEETIEFLSLPASSTITP